MLTGAVCLQCMVLASLLRPISYYERLYAAELSEISRADASEESDPPALSPGGELLTPGSNEETTKFLDLSFDANDFEVSLIIP